MKQKQKRSRGMAAWTLDNWADNIWLTFERYDRVRSLSEIWGSTVIYASSIAEGLRKAEYCEVLHGIAHTFVWIASFVAKLKSDGNLAGIFRLDEGFADIVAFKYPGKCMYCGSRTCTCGLSRGKLEAMPDKDLDYRELEEERENFRKESKRRGKDYREWTLDAWVEELAAIYKNSFRFLPIEIVGFHMSEEIGECQKALRELINLEGVKAAPEQEKQKLLVSKRMTTVLTNLAAASDQSADVQIGELIKYFKSKLKIEIADSFSWLCSVYTRTAYIVTRSEASDKFKEKYGMKNADVAIRGFKSFSELLRNRFENEDGQFKCDDCGQTRCECVLFPVQYVPASARARRGRGLL